ncbi:MAG: response regulator [Deltaproteobacteria bacterium]|nr:response regulator [Deltaproteobacteria bacterium]
MQQKTIVVADDDKQIQNLLKTFLESLGYRTVMVDNGWAFMETVQRIRPDLILLDVMMPQLDGLNALDASVFTEAVKDIPILLITGLAKREVEEKAKSLGVREIISKPFDLKVLEAKLLSILG